MRSILSVLLAMALLAVIVLDGIAMFVAYQSSEEVALAAAQQAAIEYTATRGNLSAAEAVAYEVAASKETSLVSLELHSSQTRWFRAVASAEPETYVFKYIPVLNEHLAQTSSAVVQF
ncbi:MAG: hypothetical protein Kow00129_04210 [Thermoleophilia bacterium]